MPIVNFSDIDLAYNIELVRSAYAEADNRINDVRAKHNDPVYEALIDEAVFWADRRVRLSVILQDLERDLKRRR